MKTVIIKISESKQRAYTKGIETLNENERKMLLRLIELIPTGIKSIAGAK